MSETGREKREEGEERERAERRKKRGEGGGGRERGKGDPMLALSVLFGIAAANDCSASLANGAFNGPLKCGGWSGSTAGCGCTCIASYSYICNPGYYAANANKGSCSGSKTCGLGICESSSYSFNNNGAMCTLCPAVQPLHWKNLTFRLPALRRRHG